MDYESDPDGYLSNWLAVIAQNYEQGFRKYWGLDALEAPHDMDTEDWKMALTLDSLAEMFYHASRELRQPPSPTGTGRVDLHDLLDALRERGWNITEERFVRQRLELFYAEELEDEMLRMTERALELLSFVTDVQSDRVRSYLQRVAACYVRGMTTEVVVMCRAVLDAAFQSFITDEVVRRDNPRARSNITLGPRIQAAKNLGLITQDLATKAYHLKDAGDGAIHRVPVDEVDLRFLVQELKDVIEALDAIPRTLQN